MVTEMDSMKGHRKARRGSALTRVVCEQCASVHASRVRSRWLGTKDDSSLAVDPIIDGMVISESAETPVSLKEPAMYGVW